MAVIGMFMCVYTSFFPPGTFGRSFVTSTADWKGIFSAGRTPAPVSKTHLTLPTT